MIGKLIIGLVGFALISENIQLTKENKEFRFEDRERDFTKKRANTMMNEVEALDLKIIQAIEGVGDYAGKSNEERAEIVAGYRMELDRKLREIIRWQHNAL